jgi:hypothetical protein
MAAVSIGRGLISVGYFCYRVLRCHRRRIDDRIVLDKLLQVLRFGCSYQGIADTTRSATTIHRPPR